MPKPIQIQAFSGNVGQYSLKIRIFSDKRGCVFRDFSCWSPLLVMTSAMLPQSTLMGLESRPATVGQPSALDHLCENNRDLPVLER